MSDQDAVLRRVRIISVVAGTAISLACGLNYAFSAWGPQFSARMHLSSTQSNMLATSGNLGQYLCGIPVGIMTDRKGARPGVLGGSVLLGFGYFMLHRAYDSGPNSVPLGLLCLFSFCTGLGSAAAFAGAIKTNAMNWPQHRGTATAFPMAAFGLSAFFFSNVGRILAPGDASKFLVVLSVGGFSFMFLPSFLLRVVPHNRGYKAVPGGDGRNKVERPGSNQGRKGLSDPSGEPDTSASASIVTLRPSTDRLRDGERGGDADGLLGIDDDDDDETAHDDDGSEAADGEHHHTAHSAHKSVYPDVHGPQLLKHIEFYQYFLLMGLLTGTGLMTINNIGNDAQALWTKFDRSIDSDTIQHLQALHVSTISLCSFSGRLLSGIGSDYVAKKLGMSRVWCLFGSSTAFLIAQLVGLSVENPHHLFLLSGLTGLAYGFLFGCFPSAIAETFGVAGLSTNWGMMTLAPVIFANIFNLMYGRIFDSHSFVGDNHVRTCLDGRFCYHEAYWGTFAASATAMVVALWSIAHQNTVKQKMGWKGEGNDHMA